MITDNSKLVEATRGLRGITFPRASLYGFLVLSVVSWAYIIFGVDSGLGD